MAPITTATDDSLKFFFIVFQRKIDLMFHVNSFVRNTSFRYMCQIFQNPSTKKRVATDRTQHLYVIDIFNIINSWGVIILQPNDQEIITWGSPSNFIAGSPKAALLFWFFGGFKFGVPLFIVVVVIY